MKLWKSIAALCLVAPACAQVQLGRNVQVGAGSGSGATLPTNALVYGTSSTTSRAVTKEDVSNLLQSATDCTDPAKVYSPAGNDCLPIGGGGSNPLTTKGDLFTFSTTAARLPVGTDGFMLSPDSTKTTGLNWVPAGYLSWINVKAPPYNATGNGSTDDTAAIQAAITAAKVAGLGSTPTALYFPPGSYVISATLDVSGLRVFGAGGWVSTVQMKTGVHVDVFQTKGTAWIDHLGINGAWDGSTAGLNGNGIATLSSPPTYYGYNNKFSDLVIQSVGKNCIYIVDGAYESIHNVQCNAAGLHGLFLDSGHTAGFQTTTVGVTGQNTFSDTPHGFGIVINSGIDINFAGVTTVEDSPGIELLGNDGRNISLDGIYEESTTPYKFITATGSAGIGLSVSDSFGAGTLGVAYADIAGWQNWRFLGDDFANPGESPVTGIQSTSPNLQPVQTLKGDWTFSSTAGTYTQMGQVALSTSAPWAATFRGEWSTATTHSSYPADIRLSSLHPTVTLGGCTFTFGLSGGGFFQGAFTTSGAFCGAFEFAGSIDLTTDRNTSTSSGVALQTPDAIIAGSFLANSIADGCATWASNVLGTAGVPCGSGGGGNPSVGSPGAVQTAGATTGTFGDSGCTAASGLMTCPNGLQAGSGTPSTFLVPGGVGIANLGTTSGATDGEFVTREYIAQGPNNAYTLLAPVVPANGSANVSSGSVFIQGGYGNGTVSTPDCWQLQDVVAATGTSPTSTLTLSHSCGSPGAQAFSVPNLVVTGTCTGCTGSFAFPGAGIAVSTGSAWGTSLTAPTGTLVGTIASGTAAMGTSAIASGACATAVTVTATGVATTDVIQQTFNADPTSTTGYSPAATGMLTIISYPTANAVNFKACNNTASSITPGAVTLNWKVTR